MLTLKNLYHFLFLLGLFFFPFNSFDGIKELGEFKNEAGAYFLFLGFILLLCSKKINIPIGSIIFKIIIIFLLWCIICTALNSIGVYNSYFKHTSGLNRFLRQYTALLISSVVFFIFYYNVLKSMEIKEILFKIRKVFLYSLFIAFFVGILETMIGVFGISVAKIPLEIFNYFPFLEKTYFSDRISSISYEPPFFAIYLITIAGWMFSYIITNKGLFSYIPTFLVLILTYFSGSRTGLIVIFIQLVIFFITITPTEKYFKYITKIIVVFFFLTFSLFLFNGDKIIKSFEHKIETLDFKGNLKKNLSNQSRFGIQYASLAVFKEHPIIGVGFGQQTYYSRFHYPRWATKNNYEFKLFYQNQAVRTFPAGYNMFTRLLAETGLIGVSILLVLIFVSVQKSRHLIKKSKDEKQILAIILLLSFVGLYINWMQIDTFRIYGIWLSLAILIKLSQENITANE